MARKPCFPFPEMPTLYQKRAGVGLLILLLLAGLAGPACTLRPPDKPKVTADQRFKKPAPPTQQRATPPTLPKASADKRLKKPAVIVHPEISTSKSKLDLEFALEQFKANQFEVAEYYLKKSLMESPENPQAIRFLPWTYFFQKRYDKALISFAGAHTHFPKKSEPLVGMGWSYVAMQFYERALEKFKQAEGLAPDSYEVHKALGFCNLLLMKEKTAQFHFEKIYLFGERDDLEGQWEQWREGLPEKPVEVAPSQLNTPSFFTLAVEAPRFRSMVSVFPGSPSQPSPALENAWRLYRKKLFKRSLAVFQGLPGETAHTLDAQNGMAWALLKTGNLAPAEKQFTETLNEHGQFIGTRLGLLEVKKILWEKASVAKHYFDIRKYRIAEKHFNQLNRDYPDWSYPESILGWIALNRGQESEALNRFETALDKDPRDPTALKGMRHLNGLWVSKLYQADLKMKKGDYKNASYLYFDYIDEHRSSPTVTFALAKAYSGLGFSQIQKMQYRLAIQNFEKIRGRKGFESHWTKGLGLAYYHLGQFEQAAQHLIVADTLLPNKKDIVYKLDWSILRSWQAKTAKDYFLAKAQRKPLRASVYMAIGWLEYQQGDPDLGVEYFLKAISLDPEIAASDDFRNILAKERFGWQVYNHIGWAYYHRRDYQHSIQMFNTALESSPRSSEAMKGLGYGFYQKGQWEEAAAFLQKSIKRNPNTHPVTEKFQGTEPGVEIAMRTSARTKLARALIQKEKYQEALEHLQEALNSHPEWPEVYDGLGWAYLKLNRLAESREAFGQALRYQPLNPFSHKGLKEVQYRLALQTL